MTVLVTGAGGAIGAAIVELLATRGVDTIVHDYRFGPGDLPAIERVEGDLTTPDGLAAITDAVNRHGIGGVVASHGIQGAGALDELDEAEVRRIFTVNATTIPHLLAATSDALEVSNGVFVAVASQAALRAEPGNAAYCAAKTAVMSWMINRAESNQSAVRLRTLCPGRTESRLLFDSMDEVASNLGITRDEYAEQVLRDIPIGRFARPDEIAAAAAYLLDPNGDRPVVLAPTGGEVLW